LQKNANALEKEPNIKVRKHICEALGKIGDRKAIEPLKRILKTDKDKSVQMCVKAVLKSF